MDPRSDVPKSHFGQVYEAEKFTLVFSIICMLFLGLSAIVLGIMQRQPDTWGALAVALVVFGTIVVCIGCCCVCQLCKGGKSGDEVELVDYPSARQNTF